MATYVLEKSFVARGVDSANVRAVESMFGLGRAGQREVAVIERCEVAIEPGQIVYVTGASGAGKTQVLRALKEQLGTVVDVDEIRLPRRQAVVDCLGGDLDKALLWLSVAGLSESHALLRRVEELSDGQRYRLGLAMALARSEATVVVDEFCAMLDRVTAAVVAHNVRRFADRFGRTFIVATSHDDLLDDLRPDVVMIKHLGGACDVYYPGRVEESQEVSS